MTPTRYRKKPVVIEAYHWDGSVESATAVIDWILATGGTARFHDEQDRFIAIDTLEGVMRANPGDWIIRGVAGEHYPCKPAIFEATYELAPESTPVALAEEGDDSVYEVDPADIS